MLNKKYHNSLVLLPQIFKSNYAHHLHWFRHVILAGSYISLALIVVLFILLILTGCKKDTPQTTLNSGDTYLVINKEELKSDTVEWEKPRYIPQKGMVKEYKKLFTAMHGSHQKIQFPEAQKFNEILYDSVNNLFYGRLSNTNVLAPEAHMFGWHPYWMTETYKYYPYSLLSTIAFFAYDVNENDGTYYDQDAIKNWHSTSLIDSAKKNNVKVLLTVTSYGKERNEKFLDNENAWAMLGDSLLFLLRARDAHGVDIDFSGVPKERKADFVKFMNTVRAKLGDSCTITMHITSKDLRKGVYDLKSLKSNHIVNTFIVQGYDYEDGSSQRGALAPLYSKNQEQGCIANTIELCLRQGLYSKDIILSLPLYGTVMDQSEIREMSYDDIVSVYEKNNPHTIELWSESTFIVHDESDTIWYESSESLNRKFRWAKEHQLQGVGLWGLGYDGGHPEVWKAVAQNFGVPPVNEISPVAIHNGEIYSFIHALQRYRKAIGIGLFIIVSFFILGLLLSLLDWRVREIFFREYIHTALLSAIIMVLLMIIVFWISADDFKSDPVLFPLITGVILGGMIVYLTTRFYLTYRKKMP